MFSSLHKIAAKFIAQGDYGLPFNFLDYFYKNFYLWSFQTGAANLDGIIRVPGRLIVVAVFGIFGNLVASYFYLFFSYLIVCVSFFLFVKYFLKIKPFIIQILLTLLFTLSPAFLGNTAKVGLVAAAALLPLCILLVKRFVDTNKFLYLFLLILCLNYSLIHPFNFTINLCLTAIYGIFVIVRDPKLKVKTYLRNILIGIGAALLMNLYFILPIFSIGTIDKSVLSQDVTIEPTDYSGIINIATAGDPISAFTLSKHVFLDFDYYSTVTYIIFTIGVILLYGLVLLLFCFNKTKYTIKDRYIYVLMLLATAMFIFMSSGNWLASKIFGELVALPGGWIFRSPLKWQLYIPFFLVTALAIQLKYLSKKSLKRVVILLVPIIVAQSFYLIYDIYNKLLIPRTVNTFSNLQNLETGSRLAYLPGTKCANLLNDHPTVNTELNQVLNSKQIQVKKISQLNSSLISLQNYEYVLTCTEDGAPLSLRNPSFKKQDSFYGLNFILYKNKNDIPDATSINNLYAADEGGDLNKKDIFAGSYVDGHIAFSDTTNLEQGHISQVFGNLNGSSVLGDKISTNITAHSQNAKLYSQYDTYIRQINSRVDISDKIQDGFTKIEGGKSFALQPANSSTYTITYSTANKISNMIANGSFENKSWTNSVQDCFNYDNHPDIAMLLDKQHPADGSTDIGLYASNHNACTSQIINVKDLKNLLMSFKYRSGEAKIAGYSIVFNDGNHTTYGARPKIKNNDWQTFSDLIRVPLDATSARVTVYGYPLNQNQRATTYYDSFTAYSIDDTASNFFIKEEPENNKYKSLKINTEIISPTERNITLSEASETHIIKVSESYSPNWQLVSDGKVVKSAYAAKIDNIDQGWIIDTKAICTQIHCTQASNGTYTLNLKMVYKGQKEFIIGLIISSSTTVIIVMIFAIKGIRNRYAKKS